MKNIHGTSSTTTKKGLRIYNQLISIFGNEIAILTSVPVSDIREYDSGIANAIDAFRENRISFAPGGGGRFGTFTLHAPEDLADT